MKQFTILIFSLLLFLLSTQQNLSAESRRAALIVGISQYRDMAIPDLKYADAKAVELSKYLVKKCNFPEENVFILTNQHATKRNIYQKFKQLESWSGKGHDNIIIIYLSGNGSHTKYFHANKIDKNIKKFFAPADFALSETWREASETFISMDWLNEKLNHLESNSKLIYFFDDTDEYESEMIKVVRTIDRELLDKKRPKPQKAINNANQKKTKPGNNTDKTPPNIIVDYPGGLTRGKTVNTKELRLSGRAIDASGVYEVTINGMEAQLGKDGLFVANVKLAVGKNEILISAIDIKNNEAQKIFYIYRQPSINTTQIRQKPQDNRDSQFRQNNYHALLIACEEYQHEGVDDLRKPVEDAEKLKTILSTTYLFPEKNIRFLKNPERNVILNELDILSNQLNQDSRLLIFYAGHAYWDKKLRQGYWLPVDARNNMKGAWISNSTIRDYIRGIPSKHTLLIADACFSGGIFKTRELRRPDDAAINKLSTLNSKKAITSGTLSVVPDDSVFMKYLLLRLRENKKQFITSEELFFSLRTAVINNSPISQVPQYGVIREAGDEGGEFVFIKK